MQRTSRRSFATECSPPLTFGVFNGGSPFWVHPRLIRVFNRESFQIQYRVRRFVWTNAFPAASHHPGIPQFVLVRVDIFKTNVIVISFVFSHVFCSISKNMLEAICFMISLVHSAFASSGLAPVKLAPQNANGTHGGGFVLADGDFF